MDDETVTVTIDGEARDVELVPFSDCVYLNLYDGVRKDSYCISAKTVFRTLDEFDDAALLARLADVVEEAVAFIDADEKYRESDLTNREKLYKYLGGGSIAYNGWGGDEALMLAVGRYCAERGEAPSNRSAEWFPIPEWSAPTGSYVCTIAKTEAGACPGCGESKKENWEITRKSGNNAKRATKYRCNACGHRAKGITTG